MRILVTNRLPEHTTIHWHGMLLPNGMDGVGGLTQPHIQPGETFAYEFTLRQHGTHMYHPHADEMMQLAFGMMGLFIIHPRDRPRTAGATATTRSCCTTGPLHPGTYRPDPAVMTDFDLWTFNSKVFPAIEPLVARTGERVRIRIGNLSMYEPPDPPARRPVRGHGLATAGAGRARCGGRRSPRSSASARRATSSSSPTYPATGPCTATCRTTP